jgi:hypothetical protein
LLIVWREKWMAWLRSQWRVAEWPNDGGAKAGDNQKFLPGFFSKSAAFC